jgi:hypothetical protein
MATATLFASLRTTQCHSNRGQAHAYKRHMGMPLPQTTKLPNDPTSRPSPTTTLLCFCSAANESAPTSLLVPSTAPVLALTPWVCLLLLGFDGKSNVFEYFWMLFVPYTCLPHNTTTTHCLAACLQHFGVESKTQTQATAGTSQPCSQKPHTWLQSPTSLPSKQASATHARRACVKGKQVLCARAHTQTIHATAGRTAA